MLIIRFLFSAMLICFGILSCTVADKTAVLPAEGEVLFKGRSIDVRPYVEGFPYYGFQPYYEADMLFYYYRDSTTTLKALPLNGSVDLAEGKVISDIDFAGRNVWGIQYSRMDKQLYWIGDEKNDEVINLYRLNPESQQLQKLTDVPYIFGWQWNEERSKAVYLPRLGDKEDRLGELRLLDLTTLEEKTIMQDNPDYRFTWSSPSWQPQGKGTVVTVLHKADRNHGNLAYVDFASGKWTLLTDPSRPRNYPSAEEKWLDNDTFLYYSNEDGYNNLYKYHLASATSKQLTHFTRELGSSILVTVENKRYMLVVLTHPVENTVVLLDPQDGREIWRQVVDLNIKILDSDEQNRLMMSANSASSMFQIDEATITLEGIQRRLVVDTPVELRRKVLHARVERIEYPTFDIDPATGNSRMLHAFLYHPEKPLPKAEQMVMIQSFYGGGNNFSNRTQILAEAGIYVLSPAPRGSSGFGREFMALNDKDLGGNEIIDIIYAGKYISDKLGIPSQRIGVYGGSHGGYATMRLLTFPGEINGNQAQFDWGFGISHAGFSDIIHFYENCNIPDWVTLEAGDPATEADKLRDRSPLYHADLMRGRLLLTHGTNDSRVPIEGSRWMADSLNKYHKDVTLIEYEGQGHGIKGLENVMNDYQTWFDFLASSGDKH